MRSGPGRLSRRFQSEICLMRFAEGLLVEIILDLFSCKWVTAFRPFGECAEYSQSAASGSRHKFKNVTFSNLLSMSRVIYDGI
jgi:hypothetical protein